MPTPSDDTLDVSPPTAISVDPRNAHTTCPPEEEREPQVPRSEIPQDVSTSNMNSSHAGSPSAPMATTDEPERDVGTVGITQSPEMPLKHMAAVEEALKRDSNTPPSTSDDSKDSDTRLAHSMSAAAISSPFPPAYPAFPLDSKRVCLPFSL